jgi:sterol desaturase/sphingolipid hydroxylase (fatty acid hydroxylase superfamily)
MAAAEAAIGSAVSGSVVVDLPGRLYNFVTSWPGSHTSLAMLAAALLIAVAYLSTRGGRTWRRARPLRILKVLFSPRYVWRRTHAMDALMFVFNTRVVGVAIGWFLLSGTLVSQWTYNTLTAVLGTQPPSDWPGWLVMIVGSVLVFLAYEFGYWLDHFLSHKIPLLWEFHRVHHQAEALSPATNFRVHPIDTMVFSNILCVTMGPVNGAVCWFFGLRFEQASMFGYFTILTAFAYLVVQLQHSHVWIPFTGTFGKIFVSPAHHQIHHSTNPIHFDKNMGSCLAIFDWMFGTLHLPTRKREKLTFGSNSEAADPHTLMEGLINPYIRGFGHIRSWVAGAGSGGGAAQGSGARPAAPSLAPAEPHPV